LRVSACRFWTSTVSEDAGDLGPEFVGEAPDGTIFVAGSIRYDEPPPRIPNQLSSMGFFAARLSSSGQVVWEHHWEASSRPGSAATVT
jgi:hypothetical protein